MPIRVLLADNHTLFRQMLREVLTHEDGKYNVIGEAADGVKTLRLLTHYRPALLLLDYKMPRLGRLTAFCKEVKRGSPRTRILLLSDYAEEDGVLGAAVGGARGYILKGATVSDLLTAIATIHAGGIWVDPHLPPQLFHTFRRHSGQRARRVGDLSRQELKVLSLLAQGMSNKEIGSRLHIGEKTVKNHLTKIFSKLEVSGRQQAVQYLLPERRVPGRNN